MKKLSLLRLIGPALAAAGFLLSVPATAQRENPLPPPEGVDNDSLPWLYQNSNVPVDPAWTFGELPNGVRYAVRHNGVPPGQVTIRVRIDAGSLMERENERGFAHLLEHLTFRGSKFVPDGEAIRIWQRFGVTFGSDSNAETSPTHTVYKLDLPSATDATLNESMKILAGMIQEPSLTKAGLDAERPVVLSELRDNSGPQKRIGDATRNLFFAGQLYADRSPIGTVESLNEATREAVRAFHKRWYRPENTVVVIAGDVDPLMLEALVKQYYSDWEVPGDTPEHPDFGEPAASGADSDVLVEPTLPFVITMATVRPWNYVNDTVAYNEGLLTNLLALQMINRRLERRARAGGSFLQASVSQDDVGRSIDGTFISIVPIGEDWQAALKDVRAVIADAKTNAPDQADIDREIAEFDAALVVGVETYPTESARKQADDIITAVDIREAVATPQVALDVFRAMRDQLTPERLLQATADLFEGVDTRALLIAPKDVADGEKQLALALNSDVSGLASDSGRANVSFDDLPALGEAGTIVNITDPNLFGMQVITFANGVRALLYANDAEVNKVSVRVRFGQGYQAFANDQDNQLWSGPGTLIGAGIGDLGQEELDRLTTGRRIGFTFEIDDDAFEFSADTRPQDLKDQLRLFAAKLAHPRWDEAPVRRTKAAAIISHESYLSSANTVFDRDFSWLVRGRDPRWKKADKQSAEALTPERFRQIWEPALASGPIEVMVFGDFDIEQAKTYLAETFGALSPREAEQPNDAAIPRGVPVSAQLPAIARHKGDRQQAAAVIAWPTGGGLDDIRTSRHLEVLASVFNNRLFEQLRAREGASYAPQVFSNWPSYFDEGGYIASISQLAPVNIPVFEELTIAIAKDLAANPVDADELSRATEPLIQRLRRASTGNQFWMWQLEGATRDPRRFANIRTLLGDYRNVTAQEVQALAQRYLSPDRLLRWHILPEESAAIQTGR